MDTLKPADILRRYFNGLASEEEKEWLAFYVSDNRNADDVQGVMEEIWMDYIEPSDVFKIGTRDQILEAVLAKPKKRIHFLQSAWLKYAAAAVIVFGVLTYLWTSKETVKPEIDTAKSVPDNVKPGSSTAILTLSDGRKLKLTSDMRIDEPGTEINNSDGRLIYGKSEKAVLNTMSTPRGGQYQLALPDGTLVWLNAESGITYPTAFTGNTREVRIYGEGYFEVKKDFKKPFIVSTASEKITVLGTSFNVNAYSDEPAMKASLVEGAIKINKIVLKPGHAYINGKVVKTNLDQDIAWKNGYFNFDEADLKTVLRQLSRWYNIDVVYRTEMPGQRFGGRIRRDLNLSQILNLLHAAGIKAELKNNKLFIN